MNGVPNQVLYCRYLGQSIFCSLVDQFPLYLLWLGYSRCEASNILPTVESGQFRFYSGGKRFMPLTGFSLPFKHLVRSYLDGKEGGGFFDCVKHRGLLNANKRMGGWADGWMDG